MDLTDHECAVILLGLFELRMTRLEGAERCAEIEKLVPRLGGDPSTLFFGSELTTR